MSKQKIIGLSGFARTGKDSFFKLASEVLMEERGLIGTRYALADALKKDIDSFLIEKVGISAWTDNLDEKKIIRPLLVEYGRCKREQTRGKYWTDLLRNEILKDSVSDVVFITDIRYAIYEDDEMNWIHDVLNGTLVHIKQYVRNSTGRIYKSAPNADEAANDPIIEKGANINFEWEYKTLSNGDMDIAYMKQEVKNCLNEIL